MEWGGIINEKKWNFMIRSFDSIRPIVGSISPIDIIPNDMKGEVFSYLNPFELQTLSRVNNLYRTIFYEALKALIYEKEFFTPHDWKKHYPTYNLSSSEYKLAWETLPFNIYNIFKGKKLCDTHVIVWIPNGMSVIKFMGLFDDHQPIENKHSYLVSKNKYKLEVWKNACELLGTVETKKSQWLIMPRTVMAESGFKKFKMQKLMMNKRSNELIQYRVPSILEVIISAASMFFKSKIYLPYNSITRCYSNKETQMLVGYYSYSVLLPYEDCTHLTVLNAPHYNFPKIGLMPVGKFTNTEEDL